MLFHLCLQFARDAVAVHGAYVLLAGKRAASCAEPITDEKVQKLAKELADVCPKLDRHPILGLTHEVMDEAFEKSDGQ